MLNLSYAGTTSYSAVSGQNVNIDIDNTTTIYSGTEYNSYSYALYESSTMPEGLILNSDGTITGNTTTVGKFYFTVNVKEDIATDHRRVNYLPNENIFSPYNDITVDMSLTVYNSSFLPDSIQYASASLPTIPVGAQYSANIASVIYFEDMNIVRIVLHIH